MSFTGLGFSRHLLHHHVKAARASSTSLGHLPASAFPAPHSERGVRPFLVLEREAEGVFSHESALVLHGLSDVVPVAIAISLSGLGVQTAQSA